MQHGDCQEDIPEVPVTQPDYWSWITRVKMFNGKPFPE